MGNPLGRYRRCHCVDCQPPPQNGGAEKESRRYLQADVRHGQCRACGAS
nr:MAG TPA: Glutathione-dependent formaldehyde-activating enzyme [Caudoviricetes sp.]